MGAQVALRGRSSERELLARLLDNVRDGQSAVLVIGCVYLIATLVADILYSVLNPRVRLGAAE